MSSTDIVAKLGEMQKVSELFLKSNNPTEIAKKLGITRAQVQKHLEDWRRFVHEDMDVRARAKETIAIVDEHYTLLLRESWEQLEEAKRQGSVKDANAMINTIAKIEKDRATLYQQAGLVADDKFATELAEREEREQKIVDIVKRIARDCSRCKAEVYSALASLNNEPVPYEVIDVE